MLTGDQLAKRIGPRLRNELAAIEPPSDLLAVLHRRRARRARTIRAAKIAAAPLAASVTAAAVVMTSLTAPSSAPGITVRELAYRAAAAAAAQPYLRPRQWVHWTELVAGGLPSAPKRLTIQQWTTADARKFTQPGARGKLKVEYSTCLNPKNERHLKVCPGGHEGYFTTQQTLGFGWYWTLPLSYTELGSLPRSPAALDAYLASRNQTSGWIQPVNSPNSDSVEGVGAPVGWRPPAPFREFVLIEELLATYVMPPQLTAEIYRAIGDIPGVTVNTHATDAAGRPGISLTMKVPPNAGGGTNEILFSPRTYHLMGQQAIGYWNRHTPVLAGTAILREIPVSGPGAHS